jgi:hypothetical protein
MKSDENMIKMERRFLLKKDQKGFKNGFIISVGK